MGCVLNDIVYSTDPEWKKPDGEQREETADKSGQTARIQRDKKKRRGKTVTMVSGLKGDLKPIFRELQKHCGSGGTVKDGIIEIQGDHRAKIQKFLEAKGIFVKLVGG